MLATILTAVTAAATATAAHDCEASRALPADADTDARRIACTIPAQYRADVARAEVLGRELRAHDLAAWRTTDALRERRMIAQKVPKGWEGLGWVTARTGDGIRVDYVARVAGQEVSYASAILQAQPTGVAEPRRHAPPVPLDERQARLVRARELATRHGSAFFCTRQPPNQVAFEWDGDGERQILVFLLSAWVDQAPLGGFHMYRIDEGATEVLAHYSQTRGCAATPTAQLRRSVAQMVTHLTSPAPTAFHVFLSLQYDKPVYVMTADNGMLWKVDQGRIELRKEEIAAAAPTADAAPVATETGTP